MGPEATWQCAAGGAANETNSLVRAPFSKPVSNNPKKGPLSLTPSCIPIHPYSASGQNTSGLLFLADVGVFWGVSCMHIASIMTHAPMHQLCATIFRQTLLTGLPFLLAGPMFGCFFLRHLLLACHHKARPRAYSICYTLYPPFSLSTYCQLHLPCPKGGRTKMGYGVPR